MTPKILIVDDEPLNLATLEAFLAGDGYDLQFAADGLEACAKALTLQPDLILLDVMMPELDGFGVCRRLRADPVVGRVPIIMVTALDDERSRLEGLRAGADDFITKPCRREELRARVRTVASLNRFRAIAEHSERFERLFELSPAAIVLADPAGRVVAANGAANFCRPGTEVAAAFDPASQARLARLLGAAVDAAPGATVAPLPAEVRLAAADRIFHVRIAPAPEAGVRHALLAFDDVTAEVHAREELARLNASLEEEVRARTQQLEEANGLLLSYAGFVSHDLRSPLTVMKGYLSLIQEGVVAVNPEAAPLIEHAYNASITMQELIQNILQLAQDVHDGVRGEPTGAIDPTPVIRKLAMRMQELFPETKVAVTVAALPPVGVSAVLVERVFYNLLTNAVKYSAASAQPTVEVGAALDDAGPVLWVRDNGVGFDARDSDRLFREFSRLSTAGKTEGFGLGLSLVAKLLRAHGGRIWAESEVGQGATFFVQLPGPAGAEAAARES